MSLFYYCIAVLLFIALIFVTSIRPAPSDMSHFELRRRAKKGNLTARRALEREEKLQDVATLLSLTSIVLLIIVVALCIAAGGWALGLGLAIVAGLTFTRLSHAVFISSYSRIFYSKYEQALLNRIDHIAPLLKLLRIHFGTKVDTYRRFDSRQELQFSVQQSEGILSKDEVTLLTSALDFKHTVVSDIMTPRNVLTTIHKDEFLGPLVLSELHDSGHSRLPVIDEDLDHIVGVLHVRDLLSLDNKRSATANEVMEKKVYYIHQDDTLDHALAAFIKVRHHLFIVINQQRETVGLLSLEDVIESLIGHEIVDEDDVHTDLGAIAARRGELNNMGLGHIDL